MASESMQAPQIPAQNRVTPLGEVVAAAGRGAWMGNRGRLHEGSGSRVVLRHHRSRAWISCVLSFHDDRAEQWHPHHYTPLFFLDEAVAFAAGHRPCAQCRRAAYREFSAAAARFLRVTRLGAPELDRHLHEERWDPSRRTRRLHPVPWPELPEGAFALLEAGPALVRADHLTLWRPDNTYGDRLERPRTGPGGGDHAADVDSGPAQRLSGPHRGRPDAVAGCDRPGQPGTVIARGTG